MNSSTAEQIKIVVLISGRGSNLLSLHNACETGQIKGTICAVISNRPDAKGLDYARQHSIPAEAIDHKNFTERSAFDEKLMSTIEKYQPDLVILAGFMRILGNDFTHHFKGRMLNIHPSLLPLYPGLHTHKRALENKDKTHGASIHFVTSELDGGPVIMQASLDIKKDHTSDTLAAAVLKLEHQLYPLVVSIFCEGRIQLQGNKAMLDGTLLNKPIQMADIIS